MAVELLFRLILASGSPARRELLNRYGYPFTVQPAQIEEPTEAGHGDARSYVQQIAWMKAAAVAARVNEGVVLAADTVGWCDGRPVLKPDDEADARRILRLLGGRHHELWTGVCLWRKPDGLQLAWQEVSRVHMKAMSDKELNDYLQTRQWEGCSGAYAIQEENDPLLTVEGSVTNVIGLPMATTQTMLRAIGSLPPLPSDV
jgi:septum formation protein